MIPIGLQQLAMYFTREPIIHSVGTLEFGLDLEETLLQRTCSIINCLRLPPHLIPTRCLPICTTKGRPTMVVDTPTERILHSAMVRYILSATRSTMLAWCSAMPRLQLTTISHKVTINLARDRFLFSVPYLLVQAKRLLMLLSISGVRGSQLSPTHVARPENRAMAIVRK